MRIHSKILFILFISSIVFSISCSEKSSKTPTPDSQKQSNGDVKQDDKSSGLAQGTQISSVFTPEILEQAHKIIPAYPGATHDSTKGNHSKTALGDTYNIVYQTSDPIDKIAEFFRANIAPEHLKEMVSPEDSPKKWIHLDFKGEGFPQTAKIVIYEIGDNTTEIIYYIKTTPDVVEK